MRQSQRSSSAVRVITLAGAHGSFNRAGQATIGRYVFPTNDYIQPSFSAGHGRVEVDDCPK